MGKFAYAGIALRNNILCIATTGGKNIDKCELVKTSTDKTTAILSWLSNFEKTNNIKILGAAVHGEIWDDLYNKLWLEADIVPFQYSNGENVEELAQKSSKEIQKMFEPDGSFPAQLNKDRSVKTFPLIKLSDYEQITPPNDFQKLMRLSKKIKTKKIIFVSATPQGGGVALMRHSLKRLAIMLDINIDWFVLKDDPNVFDITKRKFHNIFQDVAEESVTLTDADKKLFKKWSKMNFNLLKKPLSKADIIVIDDPQPSGLIPHIKKLNPKTKIIYRSHIQLLADLADKVGTKQHISWDFVWQFARLADAFVSHPIEDFIPKNARKMKLYKIGAATDPLDGLNKELNEFQQDFYLSKVNDYLEKSGQKPLDLTRSYITQIARFDPSKGILDVLQSYRKLVDILRKKYMDANIPQLVIAGHGSIDDPDGAPIYQSTLDVLKSKDYKDIADDIKIARLPHLDQMLNVILRRSIIALQLSHKEGFEVKVSEALMMGKPVVAYNNGGIPLQVENDKNGYIVDDRDTDTVAKKLYELLSDPKKYQKMSTYAKNNVSTEVTTVGKTAQWLEIFLDV